MQRITVSITDEQADKLKAVQRERGISVSFQIRSTLELAVKPAWERFYTAEEIQKLAAKPAAEGAVEHGA